MFTKNLKSLVICSGLLLALIGDMLGITPIKSVLAATIMVTNTNDSGTGSLRQAIANAVSGDTIKFSPSLSGQAITLASQLEITKNLAIDGTDLSPRVSISGNNAVRIFNVSNNRIFTLRSLILKNGKMTGISYTAFGGALYVGSSTTLTVEDVLITNNSAYSAGAIYLSSSVVAMITNSEITGNEADTDGGAIRVNSTGVLNLKNSVISSNTAGSSGTIYFSGATNNSIIENNVFENNSALAGGAIIGELPSSRLEIRNNLFTGNQAIGSYHAGGAVYFTAHTVPTLIILENNTFYGNIATGSGGGAYLGMGPDYYLINNTFSGNMATTGGNLYLDHGASVSRMYNNIIANHAGGGDCYAFYNSYINGSNNLIEDGGVECPPTFTDDPGLLPLADNGGPTKTMALPPDSPALDAGDNSYCTTMDQRGAPRPQGVACDLGAVEQDLSSPSVASTKPVDGKIFIADVPISLSVTFSEPMNQYDGNGRVVDVSNYLLVNGGNDGFQTTSCIGGVAIGDQSVSVDKVAYNNSTLTSTLQVNNDDPLPAGSYRLFICGTSPALADVAGNPLDSGLADSIISFQVIGISGNSILENQPAGTGVFALTAPNGGDFSYGLDENTPDCDGSDNGSFSFDANQLVTNTSFNYEADNYYAICVTIHEMGGSSDSQELVVYVGNVNEPPANIGLSSSSVNENLPVNSLIGSLSTQDPDLNSTFTYSLVDDALDCDGTDNGSFSIAGNALRSNTVFNYEVKTNYSICIRSTDNGGLIVNKQFAVAVLDANDAPENIILTPSSILEHQPGNSLVGYLIAIDPDGPSTTTFNSIPGKDGCSATGFNWFILSNGNEIRTLAPLDYGTVDSYTLCIRATDSLGASLEEELVIKVVDVTFPAVTSVTLDDDDPTSADSVDFMVTFSETVVGVDKSDFTLSTTGVTGASILSVNGSGDTYTVTVNTGSGNGTIRLNVMDNDSIKDAANNRLGGSGTGNGNFTIGETYTIDKSASIPPSIPVLYIPANNALITDYTPSLDWKDVAGADHYELQFASDMTFTLMVYIELNVPTSQFNIPADLDPNTKYYWKVRAINGIGIEGPWSKVYSFRTALLPPTAVSPVDGFASLELRPPFDWDDDPNANGYLIQISTTTDFAKPILKVNAKTSFYVPTKDLPLNSTLYWRVQSKPAKGSNGPSDWSEVRSLTTPVNPSPATSLLLPKNNALTTDYTPLFAWKPVILPLGMNFQNYIIQVDDDPLFGSPAVNDSSITDLNTTQFEQGSDLAPNTKYYWRVRSVNTDGELSNWSTKTLYFRTAILPSTLLTPTDGSMAGSNMPTLDWDDVTGANGYTIQTSLNPTFSSKIVSASTVTSAYTFLKNLPSGTTIYWRVQAKPDKSSYGPSAWSEVFSFTTP